MINFSSFIKKDFYLNYIIEARGFIGKGGDIERHIEKYVTPHLGSKEYTHTLGTAHQDIPAGAKLKLHKSEKIDNRWYVHATDSETRKKTMLPATKIIKPGEQQKNKGFDYEQNFVNRLKKHGLMLGESAGFSAGNDFNLHDKKNNKIHKGRVHSEEEIGDKEPKLLQGETKLGKTAAFGQLTIAYDKERGGWHIPDRNRENRPTYAKHIEAKGILEHMNKHHKPEGLVKSGARAKDVKFEHENLDPADSYLQDHHVDLLQVGKHGTYRVGKKDKTGHGLPGIKGQGQFRVYQKTSDPNKRMIQFKVKNLEKSHVDLDHDEHLSAMAKTLGHKALLFKKSEEE